MTSVAAFHGALRVYWEQTDGLEGGLSSLCHHSVRPINTYLPLCVPRRGCVSACASCFLAVIPQKSYLLVEALSCSERQRMVTTESTRLKLTDTLLSITVHALRRLHVHDDCMCGLKIPERSQAGMRMLLSYTRDSWYLSSL